MNSLGFCVIRAYKRSMNLTENLVFDYVNFLHQAAELVELNPLVASPIRDVNDIIVMQTAIIGEADILCTKDSDFFEDPAREYLSKLGIVVLDDISLIHRLRS
jgi:predicted nucleic acid-binding protein